MTNVILLPIRLHVVIIAAVITETRWHAAAGVSVVRHDPPQRRFFLDLVEAEGTCVVWDGATYEGALNAAHDWAADGVEIRDRTSETWGRT